MSDRILPTQSDIPTPAFLARLRTGRFTSPSGVISDFLFDAVARSTEKKGSAHEIVDSNDSILQDLGTGTRIYPFNAFFVGDDYDIAADRFFESLTERYTPDAPGILAHPRWGDIPVMPFSFEQRESFAGHGVGIGRVNVEFRETKSLTAPRTIGLAQSETIQRIDAIRDEVDEASNNIEVDEPLSYSRFRAGMRDVMGIITDAFSGVSNTIRDVQREVNAIEQDLSSVLALGAAPAIIMGQIGALLFTPIDFTLSVPRRIAAYAAMTSGVISSYVNRFNALIAGHDKLVAAQSLQSVGTLTVSASAFAVLNTEFETREEVGHAIDGLSGIYLGLRGAIDDVSSDLSGPITERFIVEHNMLSSLHEVITSTNRILLSRAFELRSRRRMRLEAPSDAITLTWELYGDIGRLEFFLRTNRISDDEFLEIPSGREIVAYL